MRTGRVTGVKAEDQHNALKPFVAEQCFQLSGEMIDFTVFYRQFLA